VNGARLAGAVALQVVTAASTLPLRAQSADVADSAFVREHYTKHEYRIAMRDGVRLFTIVYVPRDASPAKRYPIVLQRTPFSVAPYGPDAYARKLAPDRFMMREGYIVAYQDVRGRYMSEGTFENVRPLIADSIKARDRRAVDEASDTYDTIDSLLTIVPEHNGKVGQWGISYPGFYAAMGAVSRHPALVASSPQAPVTDFFFEDLHQNGVLLQGVLNAYPIFGIPHPGRTTEHWWLAEYARINALGAMDDYFHQLSLGALRNVTERLYRDNVLWQQIVAHPNYDAFWQARAVPPRLRGVKHAVLVVGGWFDAEDLSGTFAVYRAVREHNPAASVSIVMGPFRHTGWAAQNVEHTVHGDLYFGDSLETKFQRDVEAPFFRAHLKGDGRSGLSGALMFDTGRMRWERFARWPAPGAMSREYFFHADGSLSANRPTRERAFLEYVSDPARPVPTRCIEPTARALELERYMSDDQRCFGARPDVLVFQTDTLRDDVTLGGEITAALAVSSTGTDADFVVKLIDVYPAEVPPGGYRPDSAVRLGGYQQMVRSEIMRARFRKSFSAPEPLQPGRVTSVVFRLQDVLHTFRKGHRLMVQVQSSSFPLFDRNPQRYVPSIYDADARDYVRATQRVWLDRSASSRLRVQVLR
ncbi:MAG: CocE/NonD family hydrolase, partial [Betaproteobacteria bacterium]